MKKLIVVVALACLTFILNSCTKEEVNPQEFVQKQLIGKWPLKYTIRTVYTDNFLIKIDTPTVYSPVDTLVFSADGKVVKRYGNNIISAGDYTINATGEQITFGFSPPITQKLNYVRTSTIGLLISDTSVKVGGTQVRTVIVDQLAK